MRSHTPLLQLRYTLRAGYGLVTFTMHALPFTVVVLRFALILPVCITVVTHTVAGCSVTRLRFFRYRFVCNTFGSHVWLRCVPVPHVCVDFAVDFRLIR